jgi:hypothetical protein
MKQAFRLSFENPEDGSVERLEFISQAWRDKMERDSESCGCLFHGVSAICGTTIRQRMDRPKTHD